MEKQTLWERLVRRGYAADKFAAVLGRDVKEVQRWCRFGLPHNLAAIVDSVLEREPERHFTELAVLPLGWVRVALCDGGKGSRRYWLPVPDALLGMQDARLLDRLGYGMVAQRVVDSEWPRQFALEFHLLPGRVGAMTA